MCALIRLARVNLAYLLFVIVWGAFVRATGSGAGCGEHWPLCNGQVVPRSPALETVIEFTHRVTSGLSLVLLGWLVWRVFRTVPRGHALRKAATVSFALLIVEALIGAGLVLFSLVADNPSAARAFAMGLHLVNTLLLLAAVTRVHWLASLPQAAGPEIAPVAEGATGRKVALACGAAAIAYLLTGFAGAIAALGDTLFPAATLAEGLRADVDPTSHFLIRLRALHPLFAALAACALLVCVRMAWQGPGARAARLAGWLLGGVFAQMALGVLNLLLLAPVWMQLVHLLLGDALWILFVSFALSWRAEARTADAREPAAAQSVVRTRT